MKMQRIFSGPGKLPLLLLFLFSSAVFGSEWRPSDRFLSAVRSIESSNGKFLYGDNGRSLGEYQMSAAAWSDVSRWRKGRGQPIYEYKAFVMDSQISRLYAADYLSILQEQLRRKLRRLPSHGEIYAAYNLGFTGFSRCDFRLDKVNRTTARKSLWIEEWMRGQPGLAGT